jgi:hypothetical protein
MDELESRATNHQPSLVRPYTLTAGRTNSRVNLPLEAPIEAVLSDKPRRWPGNDVKGQICAMCATNPSVAEIAARLSLPVNVARVLIGDLVSAGHLRVRKTLTDESSIDERRELIGRTLRGLQAL